MATIWALVVGGGAGGAGGNGGSGGGGGGGEVVEDTSHAISAGSYSVTVGSGGSGGSAGANNGSNGNNSSFDTLTAHGGSFGGQGSSASSNGGSGTDGGGGGSSGVSSGGGGTGTNFNGGSGSGTGGGGGAGSGAIGVNGSSTAGGDGGAGVSSSITGSSVEYGHGGGGGQTSSGKPAGSGGAAGGNGGGRNASGSAASNGTGGGGGGGGAATAAQSGGKGGDGIVMIRFTTGSITVTDSTGGTVTSVGGDTLITYTGNGTFAFTEAPTVSVSDTTVVTDTPNLIITPLLLSVSDTTVVSDSVNAKIAPNKPSVSDTTPVTDSVNIKRVYSSQLLVVGGGGSGGSGIWNATVGNQQYGGGGGAGEYKYNATFFLSEGVYTVVVGTGGPATSGGSSNSGTSSSFGSTTAAGGPGGGTGDADGNAGVYGSGAGAEANGSSHSGGVGSSGNNGGNNNISGFNTWAAAGGGAGSGSGGANGASSSVGGNGGDGTSNSITGTAVTYSAGGGGSAITTSGTGGSGGVGGNAATASADATAGAANTGSGGGGGSGATNTSHQNGAAGADGVVVLRFPTGSVPYVQSGGTVTTSGGDTIIKWTTGGYFSVSNTPAVSETVPVSDSVVVKQYFPVIASETIPVTDSVQLSVFVPSPSYKDEPSSLITSAYKWLTQTLYKAQQAFSLRPYFTAQVIDDTIQPQAQLFSGAGSMLGNGSMATAPDGKIFGFGLDGSNNLCIFSDDDLDAHGGAWANKTILDTTGDDFLNSKNQYSLEISDYYQGSYVLTAWYLGGLSGTPTLIVQKSTDGGATWTKTTLNPSGLSIAGNVSIAAFKPVFLNGPQGVGVYIGCFYTKPSSASVFSGYDVCYAYGMSSINVDAKWTREANSGDWTIHSLAAFYLNGIQNLVISGYRNFVDAANKNTDADGNVINNYSLWATALLNNASLSTGGSDGSRDQWSKPASIINAAAQVSTNLNAFTWPQATVSGGMVYVTAKAVLVESISQTSQGSSATVVTTHENYMLFQSDDGRDFSYPATLVGTDGTEFDSSYCASFVPQGNFWWLGGAAGWLWELVQNAITADISNDVIGYQVQESAGQPASLALQLANANNKWVGSSPTGPGAAAIARNRKVAIWKGYYNSDGNPEAVPRNVFYIDDIQQSVTGTKNDVTLVARDWYKKLITTISKFTYQLIGPSLFSDIFDGTFTSAWNQVAGTWNFNATVNPPRCQLITPAGGGAEDKIMLVGNNGSSYGSIMRVFFRAFANAGFNYAYAVYIDADNWLRLKINMTDLQSWAVEQSIAGVVTTLDSGTMPFTLNSSSGVYGLWIRRYAYAKFQFIIEDGTGQGINNAANYETSSTSFAFKNTGTGEYDMTSVFQSSLSWLAPFTVGWGTTTQAAYLYYFMYSTYDEPTNLSRVMKRVARLAGIFTFKDAFTWRDLLFTPAYTGTFSVLNRTLKILAGNRAVRTGSSFSNGEISFKAKATPVSSASKFGFRFVFRGDGDTPANAYYFHFLQEVALSGPTAPAFAFFERLVSSLATTLVFYNSGYNATYNALPGYATEGVDPTEWNTYRIVMIDGWMYAFVNDQMVAAFVDNIADLTPLSSGAWGFEADANTVLQVSDITAPAFWKPIPAFSVNPGDDAHGGIESLVQQLRAWFFSDLMGRFKPVILSSSDPSTYEYDSQLYQSNTDYSDKEYVAQVTVYGSGVQATARNTSLMPGVPTRDMVVVDYTITTQQDAKTRAQNELNNANQFVGQYQPKQAANVGSELFDPVTIVNTGDNTSGVNGPTRIYSEDFSEGGGGNTTDYSLELDTGALS